MAKLLNVLSGKLHAEKGYNYLKRSPAFRKDAVYELKQAVLCNPGNTSTFYKLPSNLHCNASIDKSWEFSNSRRYFSFFLSENMLR